MLLGFAAHLTASLTTDGSGVGGESDAMVLGSRERSGRPGAAMRADVAGSIGAEKKGA